MKVVYYNIEYASYTGLYLEITLGGRDKTHSIF